MAAARGLDVLLGAPAGPRAALLPAGLLGAHTAGVTVLSRGEVHGSTPAIASAVTAGTVLVALAAAAPRAGRVPAVAAAAMAGVYAWTVGRAQARAVPSPDAGTVRTATGAGIRGMIPLQAALAARAGAPVAGLGLLATGPVAKAAAPGGEPDMRWFGYGTNGFTSHRLDDALGDHRRPRLRRRRAHPRPAHLDPFADDLAAADRGRADAARRARASTVVVETGARYLLDPWRKHHPPSSRHDGRDRRVDFLSRAVDVAADLGAEAVSFWSGVRPTALRRTPAGSAWSRGVDAGRSPTPRRRGVVSASSPSRGCSSTPSTTSLRAPPPLGDPERPAADPRHRTLVCNEPRGLADTDRAGRAA